MPPEPALRAQGIVKRFRAPAGVPIDVLAGVDLEVRPGELVVVEGPSGSGKSTLLYIAGGLEAPSAGTVDLDGTNPYQLRPDALARFRNREVGFVFQDHCLLPQCTVVENVLIPTLVAKNTNGTVARARELVTQVGLAARADHRPAALSGGERQRVAIARALIRAPRLLLCDEPTGNLDRTAADNVASVLLDLHQRQQTILVIVTHSPQLAERCPIRFELKDKRLERIS